MLESSDTDPPDHPPLLQELDDVTSFEDHETAVECVLGVAEEKQRRSVSFDAIRRLKRECQ